MTQGDDDEMPGVHVEHESSTERCPGFITALVLRCGQGDQAALLALMELFYAPVRARVADSDTVSLSDDEVDALVGRAFVHIWQRAPSYDPARRPGPVAWLLAEAAATVRGASPALVAS